MGHLVRKLLLAAASNSFLTRPRFPLQSFFAKAFPAKKKDFHFNRLSKGDSIKKYKESMTCPKISSIQAKI